MDDGLGPWAPGAREGADAAGARLRYANGLRSIGDVPIQPPDTEFDYQVVTYSSRRDLPEQVASLRSYLQYAGRPRAVTLVSDGSHTRSDRHLLEQLCGGAQGVRTTVMSTAEVASALGRVPDVPRKLASRLTAAAERHPEPRIRGLMGKLIVELCMTPESIYFDSDVLWAPAAASDLAALARRSLERAWYQVDIGPNYDPRHIVECEHGDASPVNSGIVVVGAEPLDWSRAAEWLTGITVEHLHPHTEQTAVMLAIRSSLALPLDRQRYPVIGAPDQDPRLDDAHTCARHFAGLGRSQFWPAAHQLGLTRIGSRVRTSSV